MIDHAKRMLARCLLTPGLLDSARALAADWLASPDGREMASEVVWESLEAAQMDPLAYASERLALSKVSPDLVGLLLDDALDRDSPAEALDIARQADQVLFRGWSRSLAAEQPGLFPRIERALRQSCLRGDTHLDLVSTCTFLRRLSPPP